MPRYSGGLLPKLEGEEREAALANPGPSWREWFFFSFAKVWSVLAFFILDSFLVAAFTVPFVPWILFPGLGLALYAEFLLYQYLWYHPTPELYRREFRPAWHRPFRLGRWTPEAERGRAGLPAFGPGEEPFPDPREFL